MIVRTPPFLRASVFFFIYLRSFSVFFFFFNDTATTEIYTLSLHDALPISSLAERFEFFAGGLELGNAFSELNDPIERSEEHTSELQSQSNLVCRLLLEKKKKKPTNTAHTIIQQLPDVSRQTPLPSLSHVAC